MAASFVLVLISNKRFYTLVAISLHVYSYLADMLTGVISASDPLAARIPLQFHHVLYPYGFPAHIRSNDSFVIRAAELAWGGCAQRFREKPVEVRFVVTESLSRRKPATPVFRAQANLLSIVADARNFACCDLAAGIGFGYLAKAAVTSHEYFRYNFLEAMVYVLLDTQHLVALHAACMERSGHGVLFVGESGAGKSSLAYACSRKGWIYISDDSTSLVRRRTGRSVLGNSRAFRFRPGARVLFPELDGTIKLRNGKPTIEIRTENLRIHTACESRIDFIFFLKRLESPIAPAVATVNREIALQRLFQQVWPAELAIHEERLRAVERLLDAQLYDLTYNDFDSAIETLEQTIRGNS